MTAIQKNDNQLPIYINYYMIVCFINYLGQRPFPTAPKYNKDNVDIKIKFFVTIRLDVLISLHL